MPRLRPPRPSYTRSFASAAEADSLAKLLAADKSPFRGKKGNVNRRMSLATIQGMTTAAARQAGLHNVPVELKPEGPGDDRSYFWAKGNEGSQNQYGITIRPGYMGAPRGVDAIVRHEVAHAADFLKRRPKVSHGQSFRGEEANQFIPNVKVRPEYGGNDYEGKDEYADRYAETGEKYKSHVYLSDYDNPQQRPYRVNVKDLKKKIVQNRKAYVQNLKRPPVSKFRVGPAARGL